jgi:Domain of unknown function (DUF4136)
MKRWIQAMGFAAAAFAIAACSSIAAHHDFNPAVNFDRFETFSWVSPHPFVDPQPGVDTELEGRIEQTLRDLLTAKGYRFVDDPAQADFVVGFGLGASDQQRMNAYPAVYRGASNWHGTADNVPNRQAAGARLAVDIFDVRTQQPAWHGYATRSISTRHEKVRQSDIRAALTAILANFPPR